MDCFRAHAAAVARARCTSCRAQRVAGFAGSSAIRTAQASRFVTADVTRRKASTLTNAAAHMALTTDATFRYRSFEWETSCGERHYYEYVVAQQPAGGTTARESGLDARSALEARLPRPPSGLSIVLIPSVSFFCSGKEEIRPLGAALSQRGHRCYILEWPGWSTDAQMNWALARCKPEELRLEYEDFWCQVLDSISHAEAEEEQEQSELSASSVSSGSAPAASRDSSRQLCVVAAGHSAIYALRALRSIRTWRRSCEDSSDQVAAHNGDDVGSSPTHAPIRPFVPYSSMVMLAPTWNTERRGLLAGVAAEQAASLMGSWLHSDSRLGRLLRYLHFAPLRVRRHFKHRGVPDAAHAEAVASWLFQRPRPFTVTDGASLNGLLDPEGSDAQAIAAELRAARSEEGGLTDGVLMMLPESEGGQPQDLAAALASSDQSDAAIDCNVVSSTSPLPHEVAPTAVLLAMEHWFARRTL